MPLRQKGKLRNKTVKLEALEYLGIGGLTFFFQVFLSYAAITVFRMPSAASILSATIISLSFHYLANRFLTFRNQNPRVSSSIKYIVLAGCNFLIQLAVFTFSVEELDTGVLPALIISSGTTTILGFVSMKYWVFRETERK